MARSTTTTCCCCCCASSLGLSRPLRLLAANSSSRPARLRLVFPSAPSPRLSSPTHASSPEPPLDVTTIDDDDSWSAAADDADESIGFQIQVSKIGKRNRRLVRARVRVHAPLDAVWATLTDYEGLADFIPGLSECRLIHQHHGFARLYQVGEQDLALGFKFNAKGTIDCYEGEIESTPTCRRREIAFNMIDGDFKVFQGKWSVEEQQQVERGVGSGGDSEEERQPQTTTLSYVVELEPKLWVPVRLLEGRICSEIKNNLVSIREQAHRMGSTDDG
ncbi:hypothetical protein BAE44_0026109 [Dichanthelium oligosanthes]|uniref:Coenzyme Q-binding protein COQ10 START domain-containing protein n=1 Tax=Dichanthelium oligosanthes TaxID=888268 RepID=A0A1E5UJ28_9POAL|nr:hypothetical protein BAE44_0026109 [Dichanthelium oligosanthes]